VTAGYADDIVAEARRDRGHGSLASPTTSARAANTLCGDEIDLDLDHDGERIAAVAHRTRGCAFTRGSASLLAQCVTGMSIAGARELAATLRRDLAGTAALPSDVSALAAVRMYPARTRCALLPWEALRTALGEV
jgi:nitrogen fixation NifU-like protein